MISTRLLIIRNRFIVIKSIEWIRFLFFVNSRKILFPCVVDTIIKCILAFDVCFFQRFNSHEHASGHFKMYFAFLKSLGKNGFTNNNICSEYANWFCSVSLNLQSLYGFAWKNTYFCVSYLLFTISTDLSTGRWSKVYEVLETLKY